VGCTYSTGYVATESEAIAAWNRRVPPLDLTSEAVAVKLVHEIEKLSWTVESVDELTNEGMTEIVLAVLAKIKELQQ